MSAARKRHVLLCTYLAFVVALTFLFDYRAALTLEWPFLMMAGLLGVFAIVLCWRFFKIRTSIVYAVAFILVLAIARVVEVSPVKQFKLLYSSLQPGFDRSQVEDVLKSHFPNKGQYKRPSASSPDENSLILVLDENDDRYNSEIILISFERGRITTKAYYPD